MRSSTIPACSLKSAEVVAIVSEPMDDAAFLY
jgi:hypothetical protein